MPRITAENFAKFDRQTVTRDGAVDHGASVKANAKEAAKNVADAFTPNHFKDSWKQDGGNIISGPAFTVMMAPWYAAAEVWDVVSAPAKVAKNAADAVIHGVAGLFDGK